MYVVQCFTESYIPTKEYPNFRYCATKTEAESGEQRSSYSKLKERLDHNCTHVYGDIVLINIYRNFNGEEPDLRFLSNIVEVVGSIKIYNTNVSRIPFDNLRVIRGQDVYKKDYGGFKHKALNIWATKTQLFNNSTFKTIIDFRSLTSILGGSVYISDAYCSSLVHINWDFILQDPSQQTVISECKNLTHFKCSSKCPIINNRRYCWGPDSLQCQKITKCHKRQCQNRCFISQSGEEECCNSQCLGGCFSASSRSCFACKGVLNGTSCIAECPPKRYYDHRRGQFITNNNYMLKFINLCVKKCPPNLVEENGECKTHCELKNFQKKGDKCVECTKYCDKICIQTDIHNSLEIKHSFFALNSKKLKKLANCTIFKGQIILNDESFVHGNTESPITSLNELYALKKLRSVYGAVNLELKNAPFLIHNLSFLSNLERIEPMKVEEPHVFSLIESNVRYLGLNSLKYIYPDSVVYLEHNPHLCYFDNLSFQVSFPNVRKLLTRNQPYNTNCKNISKVCDIQCDSKYGCWGPGPQQCRKCRNRILGNLCADSCNEIPGYFDDSNNRKNNTRPLECQKCHSECRQSCRGLKSNECIGGCRHYQESKNCVKQCSRTHYLDKSKSICLPCNSECHPRNLTQGPVCTGPSDQPGPNGCMKCQAIIIKFGIVTCTNDQLVPNGYFSKNHHKTDKSEYVNLIEKYTDIIIIYQPCHHLCSRCTFATNQRIREMSSGHLISDRLKLASIQGLQGRGGKSRNIQMGCLECRGYWLENNCVEKCPINTTYLMEHKSRTSKGHCGHCHQECIGCNSNNQCKLCRNYKLYANASKLSFTCVSDCPKSHKQTQVNNNTGEVECVYVLISTIEFLLFILTILFVVMLIAFIGCVIMARIKKKKKKRKSKMRAYFSNANENDSKNCQPFTEIIKLPMINRDQLQYELSDEIGSGAFGKVYRGYWTPSDEYFDDTASLNSCKNQPIEVAIKVIERTEINDAMAEIQIMASVRHRHCLRLIGACFSNEIHLISTFLPEGSMEKYLKENKQKLTAKTLLLWAEQIANGMLYLQKNHIIHRDLATRNVLIYKIDLIQITDFGLAKISQEEIHIDHGFLPIRWLAIEAVKHLTFSTQTDVWAFGITIWEIFSFAKVPYENISTTKLISEIEKGTRLCQPDICSLEVYIIMLKCWNINPEDRPSFEYLWNEFIRFSNNPNRYISYPNNDVKENSSNESMRMLKMNSNSDIGNINDPEQLQYLINNASKTWNQLYKPTSPNDSIFTSSFSSPPRSPSIIVYKNSNLCINDDTDYLEPHNYTRNNIT